VVGELHGSLGKLSVMEGGVEDASAKLSTRALLRRWTAARGAAPRVTNSRE
jgi:hypothetical protein